MSLDRYKKKRNFKKTPEPKGKISHKYKFLYVIQKHAASHLHYDFRLELNGVLLSWAIPKGPCLDPLVKRLAVHVEDHPVEYGHFEGVIPKGEYGAGSVLLWDKGKWIPGSKNPTGDYHKGHLKFDLNGEKLKGTWNLIKLKKEKDDHSWFLIKGKDEYAKSLSRYDITIEKPDSVITQYSIDEISHYYDNMWTRKHGLKKIKQLKPKHFRFNLPKSRMPKRIAPELANLVDEAPYGNEWAHELKLDGYRILTFKENQEIRFLSRNNKDWTNYFPNILREIKKLPIENVILDGEIVMLGENHQPNFQLLQNSLKSNKDKPFIYFIFDLIYYDQYNLKSLTLLERKNILRELLPSHHEILRYNDHIIGSGKEVFQKACEMGVEGIVSKKINSTYEERRSKAWVKVKCTKRQEFVIGGYSPPQRSRPYFGSLYLGYHDKNAVLRYCGNVGTGFNQESLKNIYKRLQKIKTAQNPFDVRPPGVTTATWVKPKLVAEVEFSEWTNEGTLRHPSFKGLRTDKPARSITRESEITMKKIVSQDKSNNGNETLKLPFKLTNPKKILYPEDNVTKLDLIKFYEKIEKWILPYVVNRPLTLLRCPETYKECFYQKHINKSTPKYLYGIPIKEKEKVEEYIYIKDWYGLASLVQMRSLEIHAWGSRIENVEYPDIITFDLDPAENVPWKQVVATAKLVREHLSSIKLKSFVKTTGGKGLHVVIPIQPEYNWEQIINFTNVFVQFLVRNYPSEYVGEMSKAKRKGKIFIDYLRNQRGATAICAYSTRAKKGATVAVPLDWDELSTNQKDNTFTIFTLPNRLDNLKKDPWKDFFRIKQSLNLNKL